MAEKKEIVPEFKGYHFKRGKRKVIQITGGSEALSVLCNDNTVWRLTQIVGKYKWELIPNVPQPGEETDEKT